MYVLSISSLSEVEMVLTTKEIVFFFVFLWNERKKKRNEIYRNCKGTRQRQIF